MFTTDRKQSKMFKLSKNVDQNRNRVFDCHLSLATSGNKAIENVYTIEERRSK